jgi:hypothetical protein
MRGAHLRTEFVKALLFICTVAVVADAALARPGSRPVNPTFTQGASRWKMIAIITPVEVTHGDRDSWGCPGLVLSAAPVRALAGAA